MSTAVRLYDEIESRLATIETVEEAKAIADEVEAFRVYAQRAHKGLHVQNRCAYVKFLAMRRAGELLAAMDKLTGRPEKGSTRKRLSDYGIDHNQSAAWQMLAKVPAAGLEALWKACDQHLVELTNAVVRRRYRLELDEAFRAAGEAAAGLPSRAGAVEARRVYEAAGRLQRRLSRFFAEDSKERADLDCILTDRIYFPGHEVENARRRFFECRDRLTTIIEALTVRMEVEMEEENLDPLTGDTLLVVAEEETASSPA